MTGLVSETTTTDAMTTTDCWAVLREQELGRLVYRCGEEMHITPVNYAVDGDRVVFRTAEGEKLAALRDYPDVVFEVDESFDDAGHRHRGRLDHRALLQPGQALAAYRQPLARQRCISSTTSPATRIGVDAQTPGPEFQERRRSSPGAGCAVSARVFSATTRAD